MLSGLVILKRSYKCDFFVLFFFFLLIVNNAVEKEMRPKYVNYLYSKSVAHIDILTVCIIFKKDAKLPP